METYFIRFSDNFTGAYYKLFSKRHGPPTTLYTERGIVGRNVRMPLPLKVIVIPVHVAIGAGYWDIYRAAVATFTARYGMDPSATSCECCNSSDYTISLYRTLIDAVKDNDDNEILG